MSSVNTARHGKLDTLTSLRFFAAAMIMAIHEQELFGSARIATTFALSQGVSFFFVLSGFILAYNYPSLDNWRSVGKFWLARFARIWPAHITAIILAVAVTGATNTEYLSASQRILVGLANIFLVQAWIPFKDYFFSFNSVAWSISTEFFFYLMFPLLLLNLRKTWGWALPFLMAVVAINILSGALWQIPATESNQSLSLDGFLYINPVNRILEFYLGMLAYHVHSQTKKTIYVSTPVATAIELVILAVVIFSLWFTPRILALVGWQVKFAETLDYYLAKSGSASVFLVLILVFALQRGLVSSLLQKKVFVFLGEISFSLYLVHRTVMQWFLINHQEWIASLPQWVGYALYWLSCILVAYLLYALIEKPCQKIIRGMHTIKLAEMATLLISRRQLAMWGCASLLLFFNVYWHPGKHCPEVECNKLWNGATYRNVASFQNVASLQALSVVIEPDSLVLNMLWQMTGDTSDMMVGLHALDAKGEIIWQYAYPIIHSNGLSMGERWIDTVSIPKKDITRQWLSLGIAMYKVPTNLIIVQASKTDWGGTRAVLNIKEFQDSFYLQ